MQTEVRASRCLFIDAVTCGQILAGGIADDRRLFAFGLADVLARLGAHSSEYLLFALAQIERIRVSHLHGFAAGLETGGGERVFAAGKPGGVHLAEEAALAAPMLAQPLRQ